MFKYIDRLRHILRAACLLKIEQNLMETKHRMKKSMTEHDDSKL